MKRRELVILLLILIFGLILNRCDWFVDARERLWGVALREEGRTSLSITSHHLIAAEVRVSYSSGFVGACGYDPLLAAGSEIQSRGDHSKALLALKFRPENPYQLSPRRSTKWRQGL